MHRKVEITVQAAVGLFKNKNKKPYPSSRIFLSPFSFANSA